MNGKLIKQTVVESMEFDGDIIITDPCYLTIDTDEAWEYPGVKQIQHNTLYGDWSCHVWKANTYEECTKENVIGQFCADAGLVMVADYKDVNEYNPEAEEWIKNHDWCVTVIKGFKGTVEMVQYDKEYEYDESFEEYGHKAGEKFIASSLEVIGKGNINFIGAQTGL